MSSLARILVVDGTAGAGRMAPSTSTMISIYRATGGFLLSLGHVMTAAAAGNIGGPRIFFHKAANPSVGLARALGPRPLVGCE